MSQADGAWFVYLVRCADDSLYAGVTTDVPRRVAEHNATGGARYTRARRPVTLAYVEAQPNRAAATRREYRLRRLDKADKERLCAGWSEEGEMVGRAGIEPATT